MDNRKLKVALAIGSLETGGAETQVVGIARELTALGVDVQVLLITGRGPLQTVLDDANVTSYCAGYRGISRRSPRNLHNAWLALTELYKLLQFVLHIGRARFDVVHAFLFHCYVPLVPIAWVLRVPVRIAARRGLHDTMPRSPLLRRLRPLANRLSSAIVANSGVVAADTLRVERVDRSKVEVIPNAVTIPGKQARPGCEPPVGVMIANLLRYKGHLDLIEALGYMESPPRILCYGDGPMRDEILAAISRTGLSEVVIMHGRRAGAAACYVDAQFAVLSSHSEGMPNAVLEAMAAGLPVVATNVGGCRELVVPNETGLLVPPHDPKALATALTRICEDRSFRQRAGARARERAMGYSWSETGRAHLDLYTRLFRERR